MPHERNIREASTRAAAPTASTGGRRTAADTISRRSGWITTTTTWMPRLLPRTRAARLRRGTSRKSSPTRRSCLRPRTKNASEDRSRTPLPWCFTAELACRSHPVQRLWDVEAAASTSIAVSTVCRPNGGESTHRHWTLDHFLDCLTEFFTNLQRTVRAEYSSESRGRLSRGERQRNGKRLWYWRGDEAAVDFA